MLLRYWKADLYGEWMVITALPSWLAFSNIGFGSVAGNDMTMRESAGDRDGALTVFQSSWWLISSVSMLVALLMVPVLYVLPVAKLLKLQAIGNTDARWILFYLGLSVLLGQLEQLLGAAYTCIGRYPFGSFLKSMISLCAFFAMIVPVILGRGPRETALWWAAANVAGTFVLAVMVRRDIPWLRFGWGHARWDEIRRMSRPAVAFLAFPVGQAINIQGSILAVQYALGPMDVAIFTTARTVSRVALQMVQMVNFTVWPEFSLAYGAKNFDLVRTLHRRSCQMALIIAVITVVAMMGFGPWFLTHWTHGQIPPSKGLLALLLLGVILYALWSTSSTMLAATNQHERLAGYYIVATAITCVATYGLARVHGLYGAAASLLIAELVMNTYVLPHSLKLANDTFGGFLGSMFSYPAALKPEAILRRFGRSGPPPVEEEV